MILAYNAKINSRAARRNSCVRGTQFTRRKAQFMRPRDAIHATGGSNSFK